MVEHYLKQKIKKYLCASDNQNTLVFLGQTQYPEAVGRALSQARKSGGIKFSLFSFDLELGESFFGLGAVYIHDYLSREDCFGIDDFLFKKLGRNWFLDKSFSPASFSRRELQTLGKCAEYNYYTDELIFPVKYAEAMRKIFIEHKPERVVIIEERKFLADIAALFLPSHDFKVFRVGLPAHLEAAGLIRRMAGVLKSAMADLGIIFLDSLVSALLRYSRSFKGRIVIDHRLYKDFCHGPLKERLLIFPFEKGLKLRVQMAAKGLLYLPMRTPCCFERLLQGLRFFRYKRDWIRISSNKDFQNIFSYKEIRLWNIFEKYIARLFLVNFPRIKTNSEIFQRFASKNKTKLAIMRSDLKELERTIVEACRPLDIPSLVIQLGVIGNRNMSDTLLADTTAVWGRATIDWFKQFGYPEERFAVTGNPAYDQLHLRISSSGRDGARRNILSKLRLNPDLKTIVFLTSSNYLHGTSFVIADEMTIILKEILKAMRSLSGTQLIVKLHPYDPRLSLYRNTIEKYGLENRAIAVKDFNTYDIIEAGDLAVMRCSSTGLAALILDKPLISVMLFKGDFVNIPYAEDGAAIGVKKVEEIAEAINAGLYDQKIREELRAKRKQFVFNYAYQVDGQATGRVEELAESLINRKGPKFIPEKADAHFINHSALQNA